MGDLLVALDAARAHGLTGAPLGLTVELERRADLLACRLEVSSEPRAVAAVCVAVEGSLSAWRLFRGAPELALAACSPFIETPDEDFV